MCVCVYAVLSATNLLFCAKIIRTVQPNTVRARVCVCVCVSQAIKPVSFCCCFLVVFDSTGAAVAAN